METLKEIESELFKGAHAGSRGDLDRLAGTASLRLTEYVRRMTLESHVTEDIVQESMLGMFKVFDKIQTIDHFWGWLYTTAFNKTRTHYGRQWRRANAYLADIEGEVENEKSPNGLADVVTSELKQIVTSSMKEMEPRHRAVLTMRCYESMSFAKIAKVLDCSEVGARALFYRAKKSLAKKLSRRGFGKGSLVLALGVFGKLTASTEASAAQVAVGATSLKVGAIGTALGIAASKTAVTTAAAVGIAAVGAVATVNNDSGPEAAIAGETVTKVAEPIQEAKDNHQEHWYYYPEKSQSIVMSKITECDKDGEKLYCRWLQNAGGNYYYNLQDNTVYTVNYHAWSKDLQVAQLPTDSRNLLEFIGQVQGTKHYFEEATGSVSGDGAGLLAVTRSDGRGEEVRDVTRHPNMMTENNFVFDWPANTKVVDLRDEMHRQGWGYFTIAGKINGKSVTGRGRMPFVYAASRRYSAWLKMKVGGQVYADKDGGSLFKGLSRPWEGLHTIDTVRRDAAKRGIAFETKLLSDGLKGQVILSKEAGKMMYIIDMDRDVVEQIVFTGDSEGVLKFDYLDNIDIDFGEPRVSTVKFSILDL